METTNEHPPWSNIVYKAKSEGDCIVCHTKTNWVSRKAIFICGPEHHNKLWNDLIQMFVISNIVS